MDRTEITTGSSPIVTVAPGQEEANATRGEVFNRVNNAGPSHDLPIVSTSLDHPDGTPKNNFKIVLSHGEWHPIKGNINPLNINSVLKDKVGMVGDTPLIKRSIVYLLQTMNGSFLRLGGNVRGGLQVPSKIRPSNAVSCHCFMYINGSFLLQGEAEEVVDGRSRRWEFNAADAEQTNV